MFLLVPSKGLSDGTWNRTEHPPLGGCSVFLFPPAITAGDLSDGQQLRGGALEGDIGRASGLAVRIYQTAGRALRSPDFSADTTIARGEARQCWQRFANPGERVVQELQRHGSLRWQFRLLFVDSRGSAGTGSPTASMTHELAG